jgi:HK97 family phage prohead protease
MKTQWEAGDRINCDLSFTQINLEAGPGVPEGYIAGIASTTSTDRHGHKVMAKAFDESIQRKGLAGPGGVQLLIGHDWNKVGGKIKKLETVDDKLMLEAQLYMDVTYVKDVHTVLKQNGGLNFSVGFTLEDFEFNDVMEDEDDPWLIVKKGDLMEVSVVTFPSQKDAQMTFVKTAGADPATELDTMAEFERALVAAGLCDSRREAHKFALWAKSNVHLLQPKTSLLTEEAKASQPYPLLDASMLTPVRDLIAKARAQLP